MLTREANFRDAVILYPVTNVDDFYTLHAHFSRVSKPFKLEMLHTYITLQCLREITLIVVSFGGNNEIFNPSVAKCWFVYSNSPKLDFLQN